MNLFMPISLTLCLININLLLPQLSSADELTDNKRLRKELLSNYDKNSRPVKDHKTTIEVSAQNIQEGSLTTKVIIGFQWKDEHLIWNPSDYGGINQIKFSYDELWKPDFININSFQLSDSIKLFSKNIFNVNASGYVYYDPLGTFKSRCYIQLDEWPYDQQQCFVNLESMMYSSSEVNFTDVKFVNDQPINANPEWELLELDLQTREYPWDKKKINSLMIFVRLERRTEYYYHVMNVPYYVALMISLIMFVLPPNSKKRYQLALVVIFMMVFMLLFVLFKLKGFAARGIPYSIQNIGITILSVSLTMTMSIPLARLITKWSSFLPEMPRRVSHILDNYYMKIITAGYLPLEPFEDEFKHDFSDYSEKEDNVEVNDSSFVSRSISGWSRIAIMIDRIIFITYFIFISVRHG